MKFSIIVPVCNVAPYLRECLDSVLAQTCPDWECICVDDGSIDGGDSILDDYSAFDSRFRVVHQANRGVSAARNKGLDLAEGDWVTFLDGDDLYSPGWLAKADALIRETAPDLLRMGRTIFHGEPPLECVAGMEGTHRVINDEDSILEWGWNTLVDAGFAWELFQKREDAVKYRFPVGVTFSEDAVRTLAILRDCRRVCASDCPGYLYRGRTDSAVSQIFRSEERIRFFEACEGIIPPKAYVPLFARQMWEALVLWARRHSKGDFVNAGKVRESFLKLMRKAGASSRDMKLQWRWAYSRYAASGAMWPMFVTRGALKAVVFVFPCLYRRGRG